MKILLDEHFKDELADAVRRELPGLDIVSLHAAGLDGVLDPPLLEILDDENRTLLTRDVNSIPSHAAARLAEGKTHAGIIYVSGKSVKQTDFKGLLKKLTSFIRQHGKEDWRCREDWL